jgi:hypothetical protein
MPILNAATLLFHDVLAPRKLSMSFEYLALCEQNPLSPNRLRIAARFRVQSRCVWATLGGEPPAGLPDFL